MSPTLLGRLLNDVRSGCIVDRRGIMGSGAVAGPSWRGGTRRDGGCRLWQAGGQGVSRWRPIGLAIASCPSERRLDERLQLASADRLDNTVCVDDTALPKKGTHSVGVAPQYASALGKTANCQTLVSLTLARDEVPVMIGLRLFLPESWTGDADRMAKARVPRDLASGAHEAGDRARRDRPHPGRGRPLCDCAG